MNNTSNVRYLDTPTANLESLKIGDSLNAPRKQRASILTIIQRMKDTSPRKKFRTKSINDYVFTITRIK